jgi:hypothetical protein
MAITLVARASLRRPTGLLAVLQREWITPYVGDNNLCVDGEDIEKKVPAS